MYPLIMYTVYRAVCKHISSIQIHVGVQHLTMDWMCKKINDLKDYELYCSLLLYELCRLYKFFFLTANNRGFISSSSAYANM